MRFDDLFKDLPALFSALMVAILFIQSGLDKVFDWRGNLEWLTGHFSKTFLARMVPVMFAAIAVLELATGIAAAIGIIYYFTNGTLSVVFAASILGAASLAALFFGQRIAKDYAGAAVLVPYFLLLLILMILTSPYRAFR